MVAEYLMYMFGTHKLMYSQWSECNGERQPSLISGYNLREIQPQILSKLLKCCEPQFFYL